MKLKHGLVGAAAALSLGLGAATVQAAPVAGLGKGLEVNAAGPSIEKVAYRRCWWRHRYRVCRWVGDDDYDDYGYYPYYDYGPFVGFGPGIGFGFRGGGHFHSGHAGHHR